MFMMTSPHGPLDSFNLLDYVTHCLRDYNLIGNELTTWSWRNLYMAINRVGRDHVYVGMLTIPYIIK